jgi:SSS family solute:Na+ symporter
MSMFGSYVSSISFLANPGSSFAGNWNAFVFSLATPIAALVAIKWFVPFYRRSGEVSAYEHLEHRFGPWARTYAVVCFLLTQMARTGTILYLLALAVAPLLGWRVEYIILLTGATMILYTIFGGIQAAVWIGVIQSIVLLAGPIICMVVLFNKLPGGIASVFEHADGASKFSLGSFGPSLMLPTFWVVLIYGLVINLGNFSVDQSYVQRYITTPTVREAKQSVLMTAALYVPVAAFFFFIGTSLFALHAVRPELFPPAAVDVVKEPDKVFPYFIRHMLPVGLSGLVVAAIFAASMDSTLSSMATLSLCDLYKRYFRPQADERESLTVLRSTVFFWGILAVIVALAMIRVRSALDVWWKMAGIFSGGMLGLFLLGLISRARNAAAIASVSLGIAVILWMTVSQWAIWPAALAPLRSPFHAFMIPVVGTLLILIVGMLLQKLFGDRDRDARGQGFDVIPMATVDTPPPGDAKQ